MSRSFAAKRDDFFKTSTGSTSAAPTSRAYTSSLYSMSKEDAGRTNPASDNPPIRKSTAAPLAPSLNELPSSANVNKYASSVANSGDRIIIPSSRPYTSAVNGSSNGTSSLHTNGGGTEGHVGYSSLPNQVYRRAVKSGFQFNLMVVGCSGLGKSTFVNNLLSADFYNAENPGPSKRAGRSGPTTSITAQSTIVHTTPVQLKENQVSLRLSLIDTPGFGDAVNNTGCWDPVVAYLNSQFDTHMAAESRIERARCFADSRVHACLYFIQPTGHSIKALDIEFLKHIHDKVNVIPVIAKSDTLTQEELALFKKTVLNDLTQTHKIRIYAFPDLPAHASDPDLLTQVVGHRERSPFAIVGSQTSWATGGGRRTRVYPWGAVEVDSLDHCDFVPLKKLLFGTHMQDLRDVTNTSLYENYRSSKLSGIAVQGHFTTKDGRDPMTQMEEEKKEHQTKLNRMETEMEHVFDQKVKEKAEKLKESEVELGRRSEQMRGQLEAEKVALELKIKEFQLEKAVWEAANRDILGNISESSNSLEKTDSSSTLGNVFKTKKKKGLF